MEKLSYLIFLTYPVSSCLSLEIILRIPIWIKNDNSICSGKVYSKSSSSCGQQEAEIWWILCIEVIQRLLPQFTFDAAIQPLEGEMPHCQIFCYDVQHSHHLREYQNSMVRFSQANQQFVQQYELARAFYKLLKQQHKN